MINNMQILDLLSQKKSLFLEMEKISQDMCIFQVDELVSCIEKRGRLIVEIDGIDEDIRLAAAGMPAVMDAINHKCEREGLSPQLQEIYDASLWVKAAINRIMKNEESVRTHLEFEKQRIQGKMEELNQSGIVVADKYHKSVQTGRDRPIVTINDRKI